MYFDVRSTFQLSCDELSVNDLANEVQRRNGTVVDVLKDKLVFSAPFWRAYGLLWFCVPQLPFGVSFGIVEAISGESKPTFRISASLFWLRLWLALLCMVLLASVMTALETGRFYFAVALGIALLCSFVGYFVAVKWISMSLKRIFEATGTGNADKR